MGTKELISVIVPVYKTEQYLKKCINSIINQTYKNLEVILVDDGSPDGCPRICDEYAKQDARIKVIHKKNGGLSSARNAGLKVATGQYITFVDSDDYLELGIYEGIVKIFANNDIDIVAMRMQTVDEDYKIKINHSVNLDLAGVHDGEWYFQKMCERKASESVCTKIFKRECLMDRQFNETRLNEDFLFLSELSLTNIKIYVTNSIGYNYFQNNGSISRNGFGKSMRDAVYNASELKKAVEGANKTNLLPYIGAYSAYQASRAIIIMNMSQYYQNKEFVDFCKGTIRGNKKYLKNPIFTKKDRIFCGLYICFPKMTKRLTNIIFRGKS